MTPDVALKQLAEYAKVPGFLSTHYPPPPQLPRPPAVIVLWNSLQIFGSDEQLWVIGARMHLMTALLGDTIKEIGRVDPLVIRVVDQFAADQNGFHLLTSSGDSVDHCIFDNERPAPMSQVLGYGGHQYFGHELFWEIKLRRFAGEGYEP